MIHFERKNCHPLFSPESADRKTLDGPKRAETHFLYTLFFEIFYSFGCKIMILLRHFHIVTMDGGKCTALARRGSKYMLVSPLLHVNR
jgi:hypothetical protein